jgi:DNA-binding MarR family transcriptional regulator
MVCRWYRIVVSTRRPAQPRTGARTGGVAFLLAQVGAHAAERFGQRVAELDLTPPQTGLLRVVGVDAGRSQQAVAEQLGIPPSRFVALVDDLEARGLIERRRNETDRRLHALHLTDRGADLMKDIGKLASAHENDLCAALSTAERAVLHELLERVAQQQGLTPGVHPGYRRLPGRT